MSRSLAVPPRALVVLVGVAGSGKTTFATHHFAAEQIVSSDQLRTLVAGDPNDQSATDDAFAVLHTVLAMRLARGRLTVVDATNVEAWARAQLLDVAWRLRRPAIAIVLDLPVAVCLERNVSRVDGLRTPAAVRRQHRQLQDAMPGLREEGFAEVLVLSTAEDADSLNVELR